MLEYNMGDFLKVQGEDCEWFAEVVGMKDDTLDVYFIEEGTAGVWNYSPQWHTIPKESVMLHVDTESNGVIQALAYLGFRPLDENTFARLDAEESVPIGMDLPDDEEDDFIGIHPEMKDFIVPDEEGESFSFASGAFAEETHQAVHAYNSWEPDGDGQKIKMFIDNMDTTHCILEDNRRLSSTAMSYTKPPLRNTI